MHTAVTSNTELFEVQVPELINRTTMVPGTRPDDGYILELISGSAVTDLLLDPAFQKSWDMLFESCPWATVFQGRQFIAAWYQIYQEQHLPILIKAFAGGQLKGVLPMVLLNTNANDPQTTGKGGRITGAGHYDALYQTWLAAASDGDTFIKLALARLMKQFPGHPISFRFLPPGTPLDWVKDDAKWRQCSIVQSYVRPLINFNDPEHAKLFRKSHFRNKFNRLKRAGEVQFECISDFKSFESSLNEMAVMYDFRQSALFNKNHFRDDPLKKEFLLALFNLNLLHVTVLKVDGNTMAAVVAVAGKEGAVHLAGINCHSPFKARSYSPGILHFVLLSKQLATEHHQYFDLTPGYDSYKEELANAHDEVKELVISPSLKFRVKKKIKKWIHARLIASGIRPMSAELTGKKFFYLLRRRTMLSVIKRMANRLQKKRKQQLYSIQTYALPFPVKISLHKDSLGDLLQFEAGKRADLTRWEFLANAMRRFDTGQHCFTWTENGRLLGCAWFSYPDNVEATNNNLHIDSTFVLQHIYCHTGAKDRLSSFLHGVIDAAVNQESKTYFLADDVLFCKALGAAGSRME
jgi:hypothetical protein